MSADRAFPSRCGIPARCADRTLPAPASLCGCSQRPSLGEPPGQDAVRHDLPRTLAAFVHEPQFALAIAAILHAAAGRLAFPHDQRRFIWGFGAIVVPLIVRDRLLINLAGHGATPPALIRRHPYGN